MKKRLKYFTQAIEASPDNPEVYFNRGQAYITTLTQTRRRELY